MRHHATAALIAALALAVTGCTSSDSSDKPADPKGAVSASLGPKLANVSDADKAVCNEVGDRACAEHLTDIALAVTEVEQAIEEEGGAGAYPRSSRQVEKINDAVDAYTEHECLDDENAGIAGSPCPDDARTILTGSEALPLALEADEAKS